MGYEGLSGLGRVWKEWECCGRVAENALTLA